MRPKPVSVDKILKKAASKKKVYRKHSEDDDPSPRSNAARPSAGRSFAAPPKGAAADEPDIQTGDARHLFIVLPKLRAAPELGPRASISAAARAHQVARLQAARRVSRPLVAHLERFLVEAAMQFAPPRQELRAGAQAVTMPTPLAQMRTALLTELQAEQLQREFPEFAVLRDQPLSLIRPVQQKAVPPDSTTAWHLDAIGLVSARKGVPPFAGKGDGVGVAILDTGIDSSHPELANRVRGSAVFDLKNRSWTEHAQSTDTEQHGTHVAGLVAGATVGVAPAAHLRSAVMLPGGQGSVLAFILAAEWASLRPDIQILNVSAGLIGYVEELETVLDFALGAGVVPVIAVGNEGRHQTRSPGNCSRALSVGASDLNQRVAAFSGSGNILAANTLYPVPSLLTPGKDIHSCVPGGGYAIWSGTSMATPIAAGVAALLCEKRQQAEVVDIIDELLRSCESLSEPLERQGAGLLHLPPFLTA